MKTNIGKIDRWLRLALGLVLLTGAFVTEIAGGGWLHWAMIAAGAILVLTAAIGNCPAYRLFGRRSCARKA